jgi:protein-L-isoaspartate(D-aspartate) O-methyltransferase
MHAWAMEQCTDIIFDRDRLRTGKPLRVLDVGMGSGYLLACFHHLLVAARSTPPQQESQQPQQQQEVDDKVVGIDFVPELVSFTNANLVKSKVHETAVDSGAIVVLQGDGWIAGAEAEHGPYDIIHVGAGASSVPENLVTQLAVGGRMVIPTLPVNTAADDHDVDLTMAVIDKSADNTLTRRDLLPVCYVPLVKPNANIM